MQAYRKQTECMLCDAMREYDALRFRFFKDKYERTAKKPNIRKENNGGKP